MLPLRIVSADPVSLAGLGKLRNLEFTLSEAHGISNSELLRSYGDFDILLIRSTRKIDRNFLSKSGFRIIATFTKGTDHIDTEAASELGVRIINADEGNHISAAEHTLALILNLSKNIQLSDRLVREGRFTDIDFRRTELFGKKIGIIGYGKVGSTVGLMSRSFGMKVTANDIDDEVVRRHSNTKFAEPGELISSSDIVTLHIPYTKENHKFFSAVHFRQMKAGAIFINTSRGAVVDEKALIRSLKTERIIAGLDVFMNEPGIDTGFFSMKNVLLTNHIAGKTIESRDRISELMFEQIFERISNDPKASCSGKQK